MHHMLYSAGDSFISNKSTEKDKNFGIDEMLIIGVSHSYARVLNTTKTYHYGNEYVSGLHFQNYTGFLTGAFYGTIPNSSGTLVGGATRFSSSYFSGSIYGDVNGVETGSAFILTDFSGSFLGFSGSIKSYGISGNVSGSILINCFSTFTGAISSSAGTGSGYMTGDEIKNEPNYTTVDRQYINRSLIKFDLLFISQSVDSGAITSPKFYLKLKSAEARELPTSFKIFAFPVSQSWAQGDGYWSDNGSDIGVSWDWRDSYSGSSWYSPHTDTIATSSIDYLNNFSYVSESFQRGGGTWYNIPCTQSFDLEVSDINMDVTPIVNAWFAKTIPNEGFLLMYSGETSITSSNAHMFYFSKETNTIFSPQLDVAWDDSSWITGSFGTGSVSTAIYHPIISGSMASGVRITGSIASGSFSGQSYLVIDGNNVVNSGSIVDARGLSETINGISINGYIIGTSSIETNGCRSITASFVDGDFAGCEIHATYSSSMITGFLSGSWNERLFLNYGIIGNAPSIHTLSSTAHIYSPVIGDLFGNVISGTFNGGTFNGVVTNGVLKGSTVSIPFTGSYSYITSSFSITSSVEITSSVLQPLDTSKQFVVIIQDLKKTYSSEDMPRIRVFGREHFPLKTFGKAPQQTAYNIPKVLPITSYYAIKDNETEEIIIDFDNYTKLSCDTSGNYFRLDTTGLEQERYYRILLQVDCDTNDRYTFDSGDLFKIRR
jgi:hypothetical protein